MRLLIVLVFAYASLIAQECLGCLWDSETLAAERQRFPEVHEAIVGYFPRHSNAFYEWRIATKSEIPTSQLTPIDFDDIAVAHDKLGEHDQAIEVMLEKISRWPVENRYESEANLGTFHIHAGRFDEGLKHIKKAIEINPDAHFGREIYQQRLIEYLIERGAKGSLPVNQSEDAYASGFAYFVSPSVGKTFEERQIEIESAMKGIVGMMRFGNHDSPILLEVLGDLLMMDRLSSGAKLLACRAYLKASYEVENESSKNEYREKASLAIASQRGWELGDVEADLVDEIKQGDKLFESIRKSELVWISSDHDVKLEFDSKYGSLVPLAISNANSTPFRPSQVQNSTSPLRNLVFLPVILVISFAMLAFYRRIQTFATS